MELVAAVLGQHVWALVALSTLALLAVGYYLIGDRF
jgi:hypothetical protein